MFKSMLVLFVFSGMTLVATTEKVEHPCKMMKSACEAAGYKVRGAAGKGMARDCMNPLLNGKTVEGVTVEASTIEACKERQANAKAKK